MDGLLSTVLTVALPAVIAAISLLVTWFLSPGSVPTRLEQMPSMLLVYRLLIRSALTPKGHRSAKKGSIKIDVTQPVKTSHSKYAQYLKLTGFKQPPGQLPLVYPFVECFRLAMLAMSHPDFPFPVMGSVLARSTMHCARPVKPDEALKYSCSIDTNYTQNEKGDYEVVITSTASSSSSSSNEVVWRSELTMIVLNPKRQKGAGSKPVAGQPEAPASRELTTWKVPGNAGRAFGALSGDRNPIHLYPLTSQLFGFKRPIAHALFLMGCLEATLTTAGYGPKFPAKLSTEFKRPTLLPATLKAVVLGAAAAAGTSPASLPGKGAPLEAAIMTGDGQKPVLTWDLICS